MNTFSQFYYLNNCNLLRTHYVSYKEDLQIVNCGYTVFILCLRYARTSY